LRAETWEAVRLVARDERFLTHDLLADNLARIFRRWRANSLLRDCLDVDAQRIRYFFELGFPLRMLLVNLERLLNLVGRQVLPVARFSGREGLLK